MTQRIRITRLDETREAYTLANGQEYDVQDVDVAEMQYTIELRASGQINVGFDEVEVIDESSTDQADA